MNISLLALSTLRFYAFIEEVRIECGCTLLTFILCFLLSWWKYGVYISVFNWEFNGEVFRVCYEDLVVYICDVCLHWVLGLNEVFVKLEYHQ